MGLGAWWGLDGTAKVTREKRPVLFCGTVDINQAFHLIIAALIDSENREQVERVLKKLLHLLRIILEAKRSRPLLNPDYGCADNSDALQAAVEAVGAEVVNCSVHSSRGTLKADINSQSGEDRKIIIKKIQADQARLAKSVTMYAGTTHTNPISLVMTGLFIQKWHANGQSAFAGNYEKEYTGHRKGNHSAAATEPGLPTHNNAGERFNRHFKDEGTQAGPKARCFPILCFVHSPPCAV